MIRRETVRERKERLARTICKCGHCQAWHNGKVTHEGCCTYPGCKCNRYAHGHFDVRP